jgi:hypothetical protein
MVRLEIGIELLSRASCGYYEVPWRHQLRRREAENSSKIVETLVQKLRKLSFKKAYRGGMNVPLSCWDGNSTKPWPQRTAQILAHELVSRLASNSPSYAYGSSCYVGLVRAGNHRLRLAACRRSDSIVYPNVVRRQTYRVHGRG